MDQKLTYLRRFSPEIALIDIGDMNDSEIRELPRYWREALSESTATKRCEAILSEWENYDYQFESTRSYLAENLLDIDLIKQGQEFSLLYSVKNQVGDVAYYEGKNPLVKTVPAEIKHLWDKLPDSVAEVYDELHNGWCYFASQANGLSAVENLFLLSNMDWGILEEIDRSTLPFRLDRSVALFSNGIGAYVCVDIDSPDEEQGFIWYHDRAPKTGIEIWPVIDEWTKMGIER